MGLTIITGLSNIWEPLCPPNTGLVAGSFYLSLLKTSFSNWVSSSYVPNHSCTLECEGRGCIYCCISPKNAYFGIVRVY